MLRIEVKIKEGKWTLFLPLSSFFAHLAVHLLVSSIYIWVSDIDLDFGWAAVVVLTLREMNRSKDRSVKSTNVSSKTEINSFLFHFALVIVLVVFTYPVTVYFLVW